MKGVKLADGNAYYDIKAGKPTTLVVGWKP